MTTTTILIKAKYNRTRLFVDSSKLPYYNVRINQTKYIHSEYFKDTNYLLKVKQHLIKPLKEYGYEDYIPPIENIWLIKLNKHYLDERSTRNLYVNTKE